ncbi:hypothetical protein D3C86_1422390 [compost metagenome]
MLELMGHDGEELVFQMAADLCFSQLLVLLFVQAFVASQVPGNLHIALEVLTLEPRHLAASRSDTEAVVCRCGSLALGSVISLALRHSSSSFCGISTTGSTTQKARSRCARARSRKNRSIEAWRLSPGLTSR